MVKQIFQRICFVPKSNSRNLSLPVKIYRMQRTWHKVDESFETTICLNLHWNKYIWSTLSRSLKSNNLSECRYITYIHMYVYLHPYVTGRSCFNPKVLMMILIITIRHHLHIPFLWITYVSECLARMWEYHRISHECYSYESYMKSILNLLTSPLSSPFHRLPNVMLR